MLDTTFMTGLNLDGLTPLPPGKVATIVTHLALRRQDWAKQAPPPAPVERPCFALERIAATEITRYRALFRAVGEPWLWVSRLKLADAALAAILADPMRSAFAIIRAGTEIGLLELDARTEDETELVFFGLLPGETGRGLGRALMQEALALAFSRPIRRVTVHTCTLDDPRALGFYQRMGFVAERQEIEIFDDPRLAGLMRREAAPHVPIIAG